MPNEILYHLPDGTAIYRGEIGSRLHREMAAEFAAGGD